MTQFKEINPTYLNRIRVTFPNLAIDQVEINNEGLVNDVVIINRQRVFRFPKSEWAKTALRNEAKTLALARQYVDMRVPVYDFLQEDMVSYEFIPGEALLRDDIFRQDEQTQEALAQSLALFLSQLHSIPQDKLDEQQIPLSDTVRTIDDWLNFYDEVQRELFPLLMNYGKVWVERLFAPFLADNAFMTYNPVFINGDLGTYHLLCERNPLRLSAIIDFGTAGIGDPAADVACLIKNYGESFVRRMAKYYPEMTAHLERARFWAGTLTLQWLLQGIKRQDYSWFVLDVGLGMDMMPIGTRW